MELNLEVSIHVQNQGGVHDECANECKKNMSRKLSDSYKKEVVEKILKHKK